MGSFRHLRAGTGDEDKTVVLPEDEAWGLGRLELPAGCAEGYREGLESEVRGASGAGGGGRHPSLEVPECR